MSNVTTELRDGFTTMSNATSASGGKNVLATQQYAQAVTKALTTKISDGTKALTTIINDGISAQTSEVQAYRTDVEQQNHGVQTQLESIVSQLGVMNHNFERLHQVEESLRLLAESVENISTQLEHSRGVPQRPSSFFHQSSASHVAPVPTRWASLESGSRREVNAHPRYYGSNDDPSNSSAFHPFDRRPVVNNLLGSQPVDQRQPMSSQIMREGVKGNLDASRNADRSRSNDSDDEKPPSTMALDSGTGSSAPFFSELEDRFREDDIPRYVAPPSRSNNKRWRSGSPPVEGGVETRTTKPNSSNKKQQKSQSPPVEGGIETRTSKRAKKNI